MCYAVGSGCIPIASPRSSPWHRPNSGTNLRIRGGTPFTEGPFLALQDELFLNLQNKDQLNGNTFDQNRAYLALGYRFSPKMDLEVGYMNQYVQGASVNTRNSIVQLALYTWF